MDWFRYSTSLRRLLQALLALAVLVAPVTANAMERAATSPASHHQQAKVFNHCTGKPDGDSKHDKATGKTCCASMCMGVAIWSPGPAAEGNVLQAAPSVAATTELDSSPAELATPPPRLA